LNGDSITRLRPGDTVDVELFDGRDVFCASHDAYVTAEAAAQRLAAAALFTLANASTHDWRVTRVTHC
jgi:hypothetical protein